MPARSWIIGFALLLVSPAAVLAHGDEAHALLFINGSWFDGERFVPRNVYGIRGELCSTYTGAVDDTVDLTGGYVVPPFADAHSHAFSDTSEFVRDEFRFVTAGILTVKNPNQPASAVAAMRDRVNRPRTVDVRYANGGLTATGGHPTQIYESAPGETRWLDDAYVTVDDAAMLERKWPKVLAGKPDFIKVYLESSEHHRERFGDPAAYGRYGLDPALLPAVVEKAHGANLTVSCHVTSAADFRTAVAAGVDEINHLPLEAITADDARETARRGITVVTTLVSHKSMEHGPAIDAIHRENLTLLRDAGVILALGTDHPTLTVIDEAGRLRSLHVFDDTAILRLLTFDTVRAIVPGAPLVALGEGSPASFLVLDGNPLEDFGRLRNVRLRLKKGILVEAPKAPETKPPVAGALLESLMRGEIDEALDLYDRLRAEKPDAYDFSEQQLNSLGYALLKHGKPQAAVTIFEKNAALFPKSFNVFDSLADGYLAAGDSARAAEAYEKELKAIEAFPHRSAPVVQQIEAKAREQIAKLRP